ncbi:MAG: tetratricopeptide repeat protein [Actinomycetota bacterium]
MFPVSSQQRIWLVAAIFILLHAAGAQKRGNSGPPRNTPAIPRMPGNPNENLQPFFISGRVIIEGGARLPEPVAIERVCNGMSRREGYTDFKGHFQLQIGQNVGFQDASESDSRFPPGPGLPAPQSSTRQALDLQGCEIRAVLGGFQSSTVRLQPNIGDSFQLDVGTIVLKRLGNVQGSAISATSMSAPKDARKAFEKGSKAFFADKLPEAQKDLEKAVRIYPQFAEAWSRLGDVEHREQNLPAAHEAYDHALKADPRYVNPLFGLALLAITEKNWQQAAQLTAQLTSLNPYAFPAAGFYNAAANYNLGNYQAAEDSAKKFKAADTRHLHPEVLLLLSNLMAQKRDFAGAAQQIRDYLILVPKAPNAGELQAKAREYDGLNLSKKQ